MPIYDQKQSFIKDLPEGEAQPLAIFQQGPFVAFVQDDGTNEFTHWSLLPISLIDEAIEKLLAIKAENS
jgi:hypothetical protein